jgi:hypothetical protein
MKLGTFFSILLILQACSQAPLRSPATYETEFFFAEIDTKKSNVKLFPPEIEGEIYRKYFYIELKNSTNQYVDCEEHEVNLRRGKERLPFRLERLARGRYYVIHEGRIDFDESKIALSIQNVPLKEAKLSLKTPNRKNSYIKKIHPDLKGVKLELFLADAKGKGLTLSHSPEIILDGIGTIENLEITGKGKWQFDLVFPNTNTVIYLSVRANGVVLEDLYRIQYIEK